METISWEDIPGEALRQLYENLAIIQEGNLEKLSLMHELNERLIEKFMTDPFEEESQKINIQV